MRCYDAFPTKAMTNQYAADMRKSRVRPQFVRVKKIDGGRLSWAIFIGGTNSGKW